MIDSIDKSEENIVVCGKNIAFRKQKETEIAKQISKSMTKIKVANRGSSINRNHFNRSI